MSQTKEKQLLTVEILEAKENPMFTEAQRQAVRFLRYNQRIACAACKKKRKLHWTMLCQFRAGLTEQSFTTLKMTEPFPPLTAVCIDHPLGLNDAGGPPK